MIYPIYLIKFIINFGTLNFDYEISYFISLLLNKSRSKDTKNI